MKVMTLDSLKPKVGLMKKDINLIPTHINKGQEKKRIYNLVLLLLMVVFLGSAFYAFNLLQAKLRADGEVNSLNLDKAHLSKVASVEGEYREIMSKLQLREDYEAMIDKSNSGIVSMLEHFRNNVPTGICVTEVADLAAGSSSSSSQGAQPEVHVIRMDGFAADKEAVAAFEKALTDSDVFSKVFIPSIQQIESRDVKYSMFSDATLTGDIIRFTANCTLK